MQSSIDSSPAGGAGPGGTPPDPSWNNVLGPALFELRGERRRLRVFLFWSLTLAMAATAGLIVFFILYLQAARQQAESTVGAALRETLPALGSQVGAEIAAVVRSEVEKGMALQDQITRLGAENEELRARAAAGGREIQILKQKERDHLQLLDKRRTELDQTRKMYEDLVALREIEPAGTGAASGDAAAEAASAAGAEPESDAEAAAPREEAAAVSQALNTLLEEAGLGGIRLVEYERIDGSCLVRPTISVQNFEPDKTAVLMPETLEFVRSGDSIRIVNTGGGTVTPLGEPSRSLADYALNAAFEAEYLQSVDHPRLRELFGLEAPSDGAGAGVVAEDTGFGDDVVSQINRLLDRERGWQYRFAAIGSVGDDLLSDVRFEQYESGRKLVMSVEARKCQLVLFTRDRYVELRFEDGYLVRQKKRIPFYNNHYRLTIVDVDPALWKEAPLDFLIDA